MNLVFSAAKVGAALVFGAALVAPGSGFVANANEVQSGTGALTTAISLAGNARQVQSASNGFIGAQLAGNAQQFQKATGQIISAPPIWQAIPEIKFTQGTPQVIHLESYCSSSLALHFTESGALPAGVTFSNSGNTAILTYDGVGAVGQTDNVQLIADDGLSNLGSAAVGVSRAAAGLTNQISFAANAVSLQSAFASFGSVIAGKSLVGSSGIANVAANPLINSTSLHSSYSVGALGTIFYATSYHATVGQASLIVTPKIDSIALQALTSQSAISVISPQISGVAFTASNGVASLVAPQIYATAYHASLASAQLQLQPGIVAFGGQPSSGDISLTGASLISALGDHGTTGSMTVQAGIFRPGNTRVFRINGGHRNLFTT